MLKLKTRVFLRLNLSGNFMVCAVDIGQIFGPATNFSTVADVLNVIIPNVFRLAGVILFILLIGGGFMVIAGAGGGETEQVGKGQKAITYALLGFVVIFISYWIIKIVERVTGIAIFQPEF